MNLAFVYLQAQAGGDYSFLIMMIAIFAIMYFFMIRPQIRSKRKFRIFEIIFRLDKMLSLLVVFMVK